jgi:predicted transcriptional regulator
LIDEHQSDYGPCTAAAGGENRSNGRAFGRSRGWIVKQALAAWIDCEEEHRRLTMEALAEVDAGVVIDHQAVQTWANGLDADQPLPIPR